MRGTTVLSPTLDVMPLPTMAPGRVCAHDGCGTILSVYNPAPYCGLHGDMEEAPVPDGYRRCRVCGRVLPATTDYFHRNGRNGRTGDKYADSLHTACKTCRNHRNATTRPAEPMPESKRCPHCGMTKELNRNNFYWNTSHGAFSSWCKVCVRDAARTRARLIADQGKCLEVAQ